MQTLNKRISGTTYSKIQIGQLFIFDGHYYKKTNVPGGPKSSDLIAIDLVSGLKRPISDLTTVRPVVKRNSLVRIYR